MGADLGAGGQVEGVRASPHGQEVTTESFFDQTVTGPEHKSSPRRGPRWRAVLKIVVSAVLILLVLTRADLAEVAAAIRGADPWMLLAAFAVFAATYVVRAYRWRVLLAAHGVQPPVRFLIGSYLVSVFFSNLLPSIIGGDAYRIYDSWRAGTSKSGAVSVILVDRVLGMLILVFFALGALLLGGSQFRSIPLLGIWIVMLAAGIVAFVWMVFAPPRALMRRGSELVPLLPGRFAAILKGISAAFGAFAGRRAALVEALLLSLVFQSGVVLHYFFIGQALGFTVPLGSFFLIVPLAIFVMMLPITINAIGLREHTFIFFLSAYAIGTSEAVAFAWLAYLVVLALGLVGGITFAFRR